LKEELVWGHWKARGHACSWIVSLAKVLGARDDIDLHLVTLNPWVLRDQQVEVDGYTVHVVKNGIPFLHRGVPPRYPLDEISRYAIDRRRLVRKIREINPILVHAHGPEQSFGLAAMDTGVPWVVSMQGVMNELLKIIPSLRLRLVAPLETRVFEQARYIGGRTHFDKGYARKVNPNATILDLPEAMNECFFERAWQDPPNQRVLFLGGCQKHKGLHWLIDALGRISTDFPEIVLEVIGGGSKEAESGLKEQAKSSGVNLNFMGVKSAEEIAELHRACSLFVLPSEADNSPNALAEAMASGMPVVAFDVGGVASMFEDGKSGLLVPFGEANDLADAVRKLLESEELRTRLGKNAREWAERNRPEHVAEVTCQAYQKIIREWE
jgi:glycosyltransferase involved in cell wall biosynthesis